MKESKKLNNAESQALNMPAVLFSLLKKVEDVEKINYILTEKYWIFGSIGEKVDDKTTEFDKNIIDFKVCQCYRESGRIILRIIIVIFII